MIAESLPASEVPAETSLRALLEPWVDVTDDDDCQVCGVQLDSRHVVERDLFIALGGAVTHGLEYIDDVVAAKVAAIVVDANDPRVKNGWASLVTLVTVPVYAIPDLARCAGVIVSRFYRDPTQELQVVGVTGTDGKTSLCHLLGQALNENRNNCGIIGTLGTGFSDDLVPSSLTTPDCVTLQQAFARFVRAEASYATMEVSSHALSQYRTSGIAFDVAVFTNLGRDHLDYHGDMRSYSAAKELLFHQPQLRAAVINSDDEFGNSLAGRLGHLDVTTFGAVERDGQHVRFFNVRQGGDGLAFNLEFAGQQYQIKNGLFGDFNVSNLAAVFAVLTTLGLSPDLAANSIGQLQSVPGRMQVYRLNTGQVVIVDYAHNPHALESVLQSVAKHVDGELHVVFGCGGDRDKGKRPLMAQVAEKYAHSFIVTDDNPRHESGDEIVEQILAGFSDAQLPVVERDRKKAIRMALARARSGDIVVIAGKGHEDYQLIGDHNLPFSDSEVVHEYALELAS